MSIKKPLGRLISHDYFVYFVPKNKKDLFTEVLMSIKDCLDIEYSNDELIGNYLKLSKKLGSSTLREANFSQKSLAKIIQFYDK